MIRFNFVDGPRGYPHERRKPIQFPIGCLCIWCCSLRAFQRPASILTYKQQGPGELIIVKFWLTLVASSWIAVTLDTVHGGPRIPATRSEPRPFRYSQGVAAVTGVFDQIHSWGAASVPANPCLAREPVAILAQNPQVRFRANTEWQSFSVGRHLLRLRSSKNSDECAIWCFPSF